MKYKPPHTVAIFLLLLFTGQEGHGPLAPPPSPGSATDVWGVDHPKLHGQNLLFNSP